jgi:hypothetical protein
MVPFRLIHIPGAEITRAMNGSGRWLIRIEAKRRDEGTWTNLSDVAGGDWGHEVSARGGTPDAVIAQATVNFVRTSNGRTLAPGITLDPFNIVASTFKPFLHPDTEVRVYVANLLKTDPDSAATWRIWFHHDIQDVEWPGDYVSTLTASLDARIEDTEIEEEEERGADDPGTFLPTETQGLLDRWMGDEAPTLNTPVSPGPVGVGRYKPSGKLGAQIRSNAQRALGWDVRYAWDQPTESIVYTLYEPPRDKTTPDLVLTAAQVTEVPGLRETSQHIRTAFSITFTDENGAIVRRNLDTAYPAGSPSYRRRWMGMVEGPDSPVKTIEIADALLGSAAHDVSKPLAEMRLRIPFLPYIGLHDLIEIGPDFKHFDISTQWSVVGSSHTVTATERYTEVEVRGGGPVGQFYAWQNRMADVPDTDPLLRNLYDFIGEGGATGEDWTWKRASQVHSVWGAVGTFSLPEKRADWDSLVGSLSRLSADTLFLPYPKEGEYTIAHVQPHDTNLRLGQVWRHKVIGSPPSLQLDVTFTESADGTESTVHVDAIDTRGVGTGINVYLTEPGDPETGPFAATLVAALAWEYTFALHPDHNVLVRLEMPRNDGQPPLTWGPVPADTDKIPAIPVVRKEWDDADVTVLVDGMDTDTATLHYRTVVGAVVGPEVLIGPRGSDPRFGAFSVTAGGTELRYQVYGKNAAGEEGQYFDLGVEAYDPAAIGPSITVTPGAPTATTLPVTWSAGGGTAVLITAAGCTITYGGGSTSTSSSGSLTANRPLAGSAPGVLTFTVTRDGITNTDSITVPPIGADTVTPDLTVTPGIGDNLIMPFTTSATNPRTGAALAGVTIILKGVSATGSGGTPVYPDGSTLNFTPVDVLNVVRPPFGSSAGTVIFRATIVSAGEIYGGTNEIQRTIPAIQQMGGAVRAVPSETSTTGTLTLVPVTAAIFTEIKFRTKSGTGAWTAWFTDASAPYETSVTLVEKHESYIAYQVYNGANVIQEDVVPFDQGTVADVRIGSISADGSGTAEVTVNVDTDTLVGAGGVEWRIGGTGSWTAATVNADRTAVFTVTQSTAGPLALEVLGYNTAGAPGPIENGTVPKYIPLPVMLSGVSLFVEDTGPTGDDVYSVLISGSSMNGKSARIQFYKGGGLRSTQTIGISNDTVDTKVWTDVGVGDGVQDQHYVVVQLLDVGTGTHYGAPVTSAVVSSVV